MLHLAPLDHFTWLLSGIFLPIRKWYTRFNSIFQADTMGNALINSATIVLKDQGGGVFGSALSEPVETLIIQDTFDTGISNEWTSVGEASVSHTHLTLRTICIVETSAVPVSQISNIVHWIVEQ